jgi:hypothetical protein
MTLKLTTRAAIASNVQGLLSATRRSLSGHWDPYSISATGPSELAASSSSLPALLRWMAVKRGSEGVFVPKKPRNSRLT